MNRKTLLGSSRSSRVTSVASAPEFPGQHRSHDRDEHLQAPRRDRTMRKRCGQLDFENAFHVPHRQLGIGDRAAFLGRPHAHVIDTEQCRWAMICHIYQPSNPFENFRAIHGVASRNRFTDRHQWPGGPRTSVDDEWALLSKRQLRPTT